MMLHALNALLLDPQPLLMLQSWSAHERVLWFSVQLCKMGLDLQTKLEQRSLRSHACMTCSGLDIATTGHRSRNDPPHTHTHKLKPPRSKVQKVGRLFSKNLNR